MLHFSSFVLTYVIDKYSFLLFVIFGGSAVSGSTLHKSDGVCKDDATPIAVVIPGLTSDSSSAVCSKTTQYRSAICFY